MEDLRQILHLKVPVLCTLEGNIDKTVGQVSSHFIDGWYDGLKELREYYSEITIQMYFLNQDYDLIRRLQTYVTEAGTKINEKAFERVFNFQDNKVFASEFGSKLLDILLSYILAQNTIDGKKLITEKIEKITNYYMQIFSNIDDPYYVSLRLLDENELREFAVPTDNKNLMPFFSSVKTDAEFLRSEFARASYYRNQPDLIALFELKVLNALDSKFNIFRKEGHKEKNLWNQNILQHFSLPLEVIYLL